VSHQSADGVPVGDATPAPTEDVTDARQPQPILEVRAIHKQFGSVVAINRADLALHQGEVHSLVGDNGAGKSTLLKILAGAQEPDSGEILLDGRPVRISSPKAARHLGITTVFQDLALINHLDATANLFLGRELFRPAPLSWLGILDKKAMRRRSVEEVRRLRVGIESVDQLVMRMSGGQRQAVAVARGVAFGTRIIMLDEPTAALGPRESAAALELVRELRDAGLAVFMISHNLPDVFAVADRITILRLGQTVKTVRRADTTLEDIVGTMTGAFVPTATSRMPSDR